MTTPSTYEIDPRRLVRRVAVACIGIEIGLLLFDYFFSLAGVHVLSPIRRLANLAREDSLANLLAVLLVTLLALTLWAVWLTARAAGASKWRRRGWLVAASLFSYMAIDDGARIHERVGTSFGKITAAWSAGEGSGIFDFFPSYNWQVVYLPLFGALGMVTLVFLWFELQPKYSRAMIVVGIGCFVAAVGLDFFEGLGTEHRFNPFRWIGERADLSEITRRRFHLTAHETVDHVSKCIEEAIEMFGTTLIWLAVLRHWTGSSAEVRIRFTRG